MHQTEQTKDLTLLRVQRLNKFLSFLKKHLILLIAAISTFTIGLNMGTWNGNYMDADGYMRALRVFHWLSNPSFFEQPILESNYPFGEILHWTRPMDILWSLLTLPFLNTLQLKDAVFIAGVFLSPILEILTVIALSYGLRRRFSSPLIIFSILFFLSNALMEHYFNADKPDHHALMILLAAYALSLLLCWQKKRQNRYLRLLGLTIALSVFTAIEGIFIYIAALCFFLFLYTYKNLSLEPAVKTAKYFAIPLTVFYLLNPPYQGWLYPDNGRISILFVTFAWLVFIAFLILKLAKLHTKALKLSSLICAGASVLLLLLLIFGPKVFISPLSKQTHAIWSSKISEMRSAWNMPFARIIALYIFPLITLGLNIFFLKIKPYRRLMLLNLCFQLPFFILGLIAERFTSYLPLYMLLPLLVLIEYLYKKSSFATDKTKDFPAYIWLLILSILTLEQLTLIPLSLTISNTPKSYSPLLCQNIKNIGGTLVVDTFLSPKYIYNCDVASIGTPYHRNIAGIIDTHNILNAKTDKELIPLLLKHQVTQLLVFENQKKLKEQQKDGCATLSCRLITRQNIPPFLEELPSVLPNARHYRLKI